MASLATLPQEVLDHPLTQWVRTRLTDAEIDAILAQTSQAVHAELMQRWSDNKQRHELLLHLGWVLNRVG